jgi:tRNA-specific 2-thiouridylase
MNENPDKKTVAVAMSGGVDSSVAAALLSQAGYRVIGLTMRLWDLESNLPPYGSGGEKKGGQLISPPVPRGDSKGGQSEIPGRMRGCCSTESVTQAQRVCDKLEIPHYVVDLRQEFHRWVVDDFVSEYFQGRTPNPCIRCNTYLKWQTLWKKAQGLGADYLATGHYARIVQAEGGWKLLRALDSSRDQSYALWGIPKEQLPTTLFPLGDQTKSNVRHTARDLGFSNAETPDSQDICFLFGSKYRDFLKTQYPERYAEMAPGKILDTSGEVLGEHKGYVNYTVGQRKGLGISASERLFVVRTEPSTNEVILGTVKALEVQGLEANQLNWVSVEPPNKPFSATIQVRYRDRGVPGIVIPMALPPYVSRGEKKGGHVGRVPCEPDNQPESPFIPGDSVLVHFDSTHRGIAPGQSVVFYDGDYLLGGGIITKSIAEVR